MSSSTQLDFLGPNSYAGQLLLRLVSRASAVIAELQRLSKNIPNVFIPGNEDIHSKQYNRVLFDFSYLTAAELHEHRIETNEELSELDEDFRESHMEILTRFYKLFESILKYIHDLERFIDDLQEGVFIQMTVENVIANEDGKQLLAEAVYLYGVMLLLLDAKIEGPVRERILISFYRYQGQSKEAFMDDVFKLCRSTGYTAAGKRPANYPDEYFARFPLPESVLRMIIGRLRTDDIYNLMDIYPSPEHRSTALSTQASMLFVLLYFVPDILKKETAVMREIVDKHFADNWILPYYQGYLVDFTTEWDAYKAAKAAFSTVLPPANVKNLVEKHWAKVGPELKELRSYLVEGILVEEYVLEHIPKLLACLRECNVTLRWLMLHITCPFKKFKDSIAIVEKEELLELLLHTGQFEFILKNMFRSLLDSKQNRWADLKKQCTDRMNDLSEYFSGDKALSKGSKNEKLHNWFKYISEQISKLEYSDSTLAGRKIQQLLTALTEVEQFHQIESTWQIKVFLQETRAALQQMIRTVNVKDDVLTAMSVVSDMSYGWLLIRDYVDLMQTRIKRDPATVIMLRSVFLKLSTILELPLVRITQAQSPDMISVSEFYSGELVAFVRHVLSIIPKSMFLILDQIIALQTDRLNEIPTRADKDKLREHAQLDERYELARLTHDVSVFTEGILAMDTTLMGVIEVDPRRLLEDGIRKELVEKITTILDTTLVFKQKKSSIEEVEQKLGHLTDTLEGVRRSFEYIQDYIRCYGLKIWQEEFSRIINYHVQQECNTFVKKKILDWQSEFQDEARPIPIFPPKDSKSVNFMGRIAREILHNTDPQRTIFVDQMSAWFDQNGKEVVGIKTFSLLNKSVGVFGLSGLDKLLSFMLVKELHKALTYIGSTLDKKTRAVVAECLTELGPADNLPKGGNKAYSHVTAKLSRFFGPLLDHIMAIGQGQLLRQQISNELNFASKLDSSNLLGCLDILNTALITDVQAHYKNPEKPYPNVGNPLFSELSDYLVNCGIESPIRKIYVTAEPPEEIAFLLFAFVIAQLPRLSYNPKIASLTARSAKDSLDGIPLVVGVYSILKQVHSQYTQQFIAFLGQHARSHINSADAKNAADLPFEVVQSLLFFEDMCKVTDITRKSIECYVPSYVFDRFSHSEK